MRSNRVPSTGSVAGHGADDVRRDDIDASVETVSEQAFSRYGRSAYRGWPFAFRPRTLRLDPHRDGNALNDFCYLSRVVPPT